MIKSKILLDLLLPKIVEVSGHKGVNILKEKSYTIKLEEMIKKFISDYEDTEIDCGSFQKFIEDDSSINKIINHFNNINTIERNSDKKFVCHISDEAFEFINEEKNIIGNPRINNKVILKKYFNDLISIINRLISDSIGLENRQITNLVMRNNDNNIEIYEDTVEMSEGRIIAKMEELLSKYQVRDIELQEGALIDNQLIKTLTNNDITFDSETKIIIDSNEGDLKGEFIVKYNNFLSCFNSVNEMLDYLHFTQKTIELEPIELRTMVGDKIVQEWKTSEKYDGEVYHLRFTSYGEMKIIEKRLKENIDQEQSKIKLILYPQKIDEYLKIDLENEEFDTILPSIILKIEERQVLADNHAIIILSNKGQEDSYVYIEFIFEINNGIIINTKTNIKSMKKHKALYNLKWLMFMINLKKSKQIYARRVEDSTIAFEANIQTIEGLEYIEKDIQLMKTILYIEKKFNIEFDLPDIIDNDEAKTIFSLVEIIKFGKIKFNISSIEFNFEEDVTLEKINKNDKMMIHFTSDDKYRILNKEIDLGEQLILLPKITVEKVLENKLTIQSPEESKNLVIYKRYYGDYNIEEIFKKENIGIFEN